MGWKLKLDREREWPAGTNVGEIAFRDPSLRIMRGLPPIEEVRTFPDKSTTYVIRWDAVELWLTALVERPEDAGLIPQLTASECDRAKDTLLRFFTGAAAERDKSASQTTSVSEPSSGAIRID